MKEPLWLRRDWVDALHFQQLKRFGGLYGIRDEGAIESALARPRNQWVYAPTQEIVTLAAAYGFGLCRGHGYVDGNKRIAFMAMAVFLDLNGWVLDAPESEVVVTLVNLASGAINEEELADWLRRYAQVASGAY